MESAPTLEDVAKAAGVSTATVSRCLNSPERVVEKTRDRVLKAVTQLGYTPNFGARVMAAKRTYTIGAIIPTMENAIFARGLQAFQEELRRRGYTLLVSSSAYKPEIEEEQIRALVARGADGILLIGHARAASVYSYLDVQKVPCLVAWTYSDTSIRTSVGFDNAKAMYGLASKALALGHREIGVISGRILDNDRALQRVQGIKQAVAEHGDARLHMVETSYGIETGAIAFESLLSHSIRPTVVLCGNDVLAAGAVRRALTLGLRVPEDISITGFDDLEISTIISPNLTTIQVPHQEMGRQAAARIVALVEGHVDVRSLELQTAIVMRDTLGKNLGKT